ncbi:hypothetical protein KVR01_011542 [Diaporthe batatas]|uniref:uncharacterized protein n=1 Tax=Diaporthe batatas TaxID=748121 RepID=UPI001D0449C5|nr:uncharacterized protein KVR01_011542 [Diaporthe batatas]KAG8158420.1 hypothetical protein KVR01_011542 [Diaporthe batatas]
MAGLELVAIQDSTTGLDHALASLSAFLNSNSVYLDAFVQETKNFVRGTYDALEILVPFHIGTRPSPGVTTTELTDLESGINVLEFPHAGQDLEDNHLEHADGSEDVQLATMGEQLEHVEELSSHPYQALMQMLVRFFGPLSLIVVPGLVLAVITGHLSWDVALCGALATVLTAQFPRKSS